MTMIRRMHFISFGAGSGPSGVPLSPVILPRLCKSLWSAVGTSTFPDQMILLMYFACVRSVVRNDFSCFLTTHPDVAT